MNFETFLADPEQVVAALIFLDDRQTDFERISRMTLERNGVGFNAPDARILSPLAAKARARGSLTEEELTRARQHLWKYRIQLMEIELSGPTCKFSPAIVGSERKN